MHDLWSTLVTGKAVAIAGLVTLAAVTPGPNNFLVLRTAARAGVQGALPAIAGVVLGGLAVLAIAALVGTAVPGLRPVIGGAGCAYLGWLGITLIRGAGGPARAAGAPGATAVSGGPAASAAGLFIFQLLNPKSWVMAMAATAQPGASRAALVVMFSVIPLACLLVWAAAGAALTRWLTRPRMAAWVDRGMGGLLVVAALALVELP